MPTQSAETQTTFKSRSKPKESVIYAGIRFKKSKNGFTEFYCRCGARYSLQAARKLGWKCERCNEVIIE